MKGCIHWTLTDEIEQEQLSRKLSRPLSGTEIGIWWLFQESAIAWEPATQSSTGSYKMDRFSRTGPGYGRSHYIRSTDVWTSMQDFALADTVLVGCNGQTRRALSCIARFGRGPGRSMLCIFVIPIPYSPDYHSAHFPPILQITKLNCIAK